MLKTKFIIYAILFSFGSSFGQEKSNYISFGNFLNEASYWFYEQDFDSARYFFNKAEQFELTFYPVEAQLYSRTLWELGHKEKSVEVLLKAGRSDLFKNDTTYYKGMTSIEREEILKKLPELNHEITDERFLLIDQLGSADQMYRRKVKATKDKDSLAYYYRLMDYQDSVNFLMLMKDVSENGYIGGYTYSGVKVNGILLHAKTSWMMKSYKLFMHEIENGRMNLYEFAGAWDRRVTMPQNDKHQPYNIYHPLDSNEIDSPELVFVNRCLIGMSPYFDIHAPKVYRRGMTPPKSKLYDYYKRRKENFNCIEIR